MLNEICADRLPPVKFPGEQSERPRQTANGRSVHIVVPTSLDGTDVPALMLGMQLAAVQPHTVTLLHVQPPEVKRDAPHGLDAIRLLHRPSYQVNGKKPPRGGGASNDSHRSRVKAYIERSLPEHLLRGVDVRVECRTGDVADSIAKFAEEHSADFVIMASGLGMGWQPAIPSSCVRRVLRLTRRQVILVRAASAGDGREE